jgi:hypothetical protein
MESTNTNREERDIFDEFETKNRLGKYASKNYIKDQIESGLATYRSWISLSKHDDVEFRKWQLANQLVGKYTEGEIRAILEFLKTFRK